MWETEGLRGVEVRTVDGYQGREKEVIILSMDMNYTDFHPEFTFFHKSNKSKILLQQ